MSTERPQAPVMNRRTFLKGAVSIAAGGLGVATIAGCAPGESTTVGPTTSVDKLSTTLATVSGSTTTIEPATTVAATTTTEVLISRYEPTGEFLTDGTPTPLGTFEETRNFPEYGTIAKAMGIVDKTYTEEMEFDNKTYNIAFVDMVFGYDSDNQPIKAKILIGTISDPVDPDFDIVSAGVVDQRDPNGNGATSDYAWRSVQELIDPTNRKTGLIRGRQVGFEFNTFLNPEIVAQDRATLPNDPDEITFYEVWQSALLYNAQLDEKLHGEVVNLGMDVPIAFAQGQFLFAPPPSPSIILEPSSTAP